MIGRNRYEVASEVKRIVSETMAVPIASISGETRIAEDLDATSMDIVTIAISLDDIFETEIDLTKIPSSNVTVDWIVDYLCMAVMS